MEFGGFGVECSCDVVFFGKVGDGGECVGVGEYVVVDCWVDIFFGLWVVDGFFYCVFDVVLLI